MNGPIAQVIALASYGNAFLGQAITSLPELLGSNSTFQYVRALRFVHQHHWLGTASSGREVASETAAWFSDLRARGAAGLEVFRVPRHDLDLPAHASVGFVGGETCGLIAHFAGELEGWIGEWGVLQRPDNRIWAVTYTDAPASSATHVPSAPELARALDSRLEEAERFCADADLAFWGATFADARRRLADASPRIEYHPDMVPTDFGPLPARQLLAAATRAWAFGGMGSFNDVWFDDSALGPRYKALIPALFEAVMGALIGGANAGGV